MLLFPVPIYLPRDVLLYLKESIQLPVFDLVQQRCCDVHVHVQGCFTCREFRQGCNSGFQRLGVT